MASKLNCDEFLKTQDDWCGPVSAFFTSMTGSLAAATMLFLVRLMIKYAEKPKSHCLTLFTMILMITGLASKVWFSLSLILPMNRLIYNLL